jgi:ABC-2 type transport system ATP-binding protein
LKEEIQMSVLTLEKVSKKIGSRLIVDNLSMTVQPGEIYGFLGPNGAGKTTTIRMIVGLIRPTHGIIRIDGHDVQRERAKALHGIGTIVENPETYKYLTGRQNLVHYARLAGIPDRSRRIDEVLDIVGLKERLDDKVRQYSLGMRQRLGLAQALLAKPKLLVLDEPTNGLDPAGMREFRELMRRLAGEGMSVFVSSHLLSELQLMCDRVAILKGGRIITEQRMEDLIDGTIRAIRVRVGEVAQAEKALAEAGLTVRGEAGNLITVQIGNEHVPGMIRTLISANVDVYSVEPVKESLEDTFLELTGEEERSEEIAATVGGGVHA